MSKFAIRLLSLAMYATSLPVIPMITPAQAETSTGGHIKKHKKALASAVSEPWYVGQVQPPVPPYIQPGPIRPPGPRPRHRLQDLSSSN